MSFIYVMYINVCLLMILCCWASSINDKSKHYQ
jgi:hypothetical protein